MIFVITEHKDNKPKPITNELLVFAQRVGKEFNQPITAVVLGSNNGPVADELKSKKIDRVVTVDHADLAEYSPEAYVSVLKSLITFEKPFLVVAGHTTQGFDF